MAMKNGLKVGVKIWPDKADYALEIAEHVDFIEIMARRGGDFSFLQDIDLPFVVHAEHGGQGVNYADIANRSVSNESIRLAIDLADRINARVIVAHSGFLDSTPNTSPENVTEFLKGIKDSRIVVENLVFREPMGGKVVTYPFSTPEQMKPLLEATGKGMCLDLSHTNVTASFMGADYMEMLNRFMELRPRHFHACGGVAGKPDDLHLHVWEGTLDIAAFKRMLPKGAWVTLETPTDLEGQLRDIEVMRA
jgi:sugar phosphate isomerase/epimerase